MKNEFFLLCCSKLQWTKVSLFLFGFRFSLPHAKIFTSYLNFFWCSVQKYLFWDGSIEPVLSKTDIWNQTSMMRVISQEDTWEIDDSIWYDAGAEEEKHVLLKTAPLPQKCCGFFIILHYFRIRFKGFEWRRNAPPVQSNQ